MCGRFTIVAGALAYQLEFNLQMDESIEHDWNAHYNIAPGQFIPAVRDPWERKMEFMQWGLLPAWAKDDKAHIRLINVRAETIMEKVTFRTLMQQGQRCLIFADGFYEWKPAEKKGAPKTPYYFRLRSGKPFAFAGLWATGLTSDQKPVPTCAIITCAPNALMHAIHSRMPVIFDSAHAWEWLSQTPAAQLVLLLQPFPESEMMAYPVSLLVNNPAADAPECILPVGK